MAGSFNHLLDADGGFTFKLIENLGDAHEACEECFDIIAALVGSDRKKLVAACDQANAPRPQGVPVLGARS